MRWLWAVDTFSSAVIFIKNLIPTPPQSRVKLKNITRLQCRIHCWLPTVLANTKTNKLNSIVLIYWRVGHLCQHPCHTFKFPLICTITCWNKLLDKFLSMQQSATALACSSMQRWVGICGTEWGSNGKARLFPPHGRWRVTGAEEKGSGNRVIWRSGEGAWGNLFALFWDKLTNLRWLTLSVLLN